MNDELQIGDWHHSPLHIFAPNTLYMIKACTSYKQHIFDSPTKLELLQDILFEAVQVYERGLQTWALFTSHTRFITRSPEDGASLKRLIRRLH